MHLKISSAKRRPFCLGLSVLKLVQVLTWYHLLLREAMFNEVYDITWQRHKVINDKPIYSPAYAVSQQVTTPPGRDKDLWYNLEEIYSYIRRITNMPFVCALSYEPNFIWQQNLQSSNSLSIRSLYVP